jgi:hypothetical protein
MVPVSVYQPGATTSTPPPPDYLAYLLSQRAHGARFSDQRTTTVGGWPATIVTANTAKGLDGSIGCQTKGLTAGDCFGLQPDLTLRIAVIDADGRTLLAWLRHGKTGDPGDAKTEFASFEQMLSSIRFRGGKPQASTEAAPAVATPIDGVWSTTFTKRELVSSPLLMDQGEVNDGNWGHWTFTFKQGRFTFTQKNQRTASSTKGTFKVVGDTVDLSLENAEHFVMRWSIAGDKLTFKRDESIGVGPTPFVISSWKRER